MFLVSVLPYIVPFAVMIYPIAVTFRALKNAQKDPEEAEDLDPEGELKKDDLRYGLKNPELGFSNRERTTRQRIKKLKSLSFQFQDKSDVGPDHRGDLRGRAPTARPNGTRHLSPHGAG